MSKWPHHMRRITVRPEKTAKYPILRNLPSKDLRALLAAMMDPPTGRRNLVERIFKELPELITLRLCLIGGKDPTLLSLRKIR